jgi:hypothetical protein
MEKYFLIYKIKNNITNKFYVGAHETYNIDDGYMGSGTYLKRAQKKYGIENFTKEIIYFCESKEEMYDREKELVELSENTYNVIEGGRGGWSFARSKITEETYTKISATMKKPEYLEKTKEQRKKSSERLKKMQKDPSIREKQRQSLIKKMGDSNWKETIGKERSQKIAETLRKKTAEIMTEERNKKVSEAMIGRVCVSINGVKKRLKPDDPLLEHPDIVLGWN